MVIVIYFFRKKKISLRLKTLFIQEMIKNKVLFNGIFAPCFSHSSAEFKIFAKAFEKSASKVKKSFKFGIKKYLKSKIVKPVFSKFN